MDKLGFLEGEVTEPVVEQVEEVAPAAPEPEPQPSPLEPPVLNVETPKEPIMVPLAALQEVRDELKTVKSDFASYREQQVPQPATVEVPDRYEDPEGYDQHQQFQSQQRVLNVKLDLSEEMMREKHGDELVDKAKSWALEQFRSKPGFQQEVLSQRNPYGYVVQHYQRDQIAGSVTQDDFAQFQAWKAAQANPQPAPAVQPAQTQELPPPSLVSAPSAGGVQHTAQGPGVAYDGLFKG